MSTPADSIGLGSLAAAEARFISNYPTYSSTRILDELRDSEYRRLDQQGHVYLDYTGGGLYAASQLNQHQELLANGVFGNPHSANPTSLAMTVLVERARAFVLSYFNASPEEYVVIFTPNASGALKLVGESYPFATGGRFLPIFDNHNSVNGIREFARRKGAKVTYLRTKLPELRLDENELTSLLEEADPTQANLFAYPAQSNFTGVQHSMEWIDRARKRGWDILLDCAAFVPTNRLDLSQWNPDFVPISFYKMFGYPTGVGCLLARRSALAKLHRPWFAGGTITITSVQGEGWHRLIDNEAGFEDGTVNYLSLPAVEIGLRYLVDIGLDVIHERVRCLTGWLLDQLQKRRHKTGKPLVHIYGPMTTQQRGGTISFNLDDPQGRRLDYRRVEMLANQAQISLRTGCFCNPGSGEIVHDLTREDMARVFDNQHSLTFESFYEMACDVSQKHPSTIRISVGLATNFADVYRFVRFLDTFLDRSAAEINALPIKHTDYDTPRDAA